MKQFLLNLLSIFVAIFVTLFIIIGIFSAVVFFAVKDDKPEVNKGSVLVLNINRPISDRPVTVEPSEIIQNAVLGGGVSSTINFRELLHTIDYAATDERISGIYLTGSVPTGGTYFSGQATLLEVRQALEDFRESGKPIYAYNDSYNMRSYFLASVADSIFMHPFGSLSVPGYSTSRTFYQNAMERFRVKLYISRAGSFKSALEPYFRTEMSAEDRLQRMSILEGSYNQFMQAVSDSRGIEPELIEAFSSDPIRMRDANAVLEAGFADRITYYDEALSALRAFTEIEDESKPFTQVSYANYASNAGSKKYESGKDNIALVIAEGGIVGGSGKSNIAGDYTARLLRGIRTDEDVKAVVVRVNSPGGGVTPSEIILREMRLLAQEKPVVVSMGNVAASGGYWISSYADHIFAAPATITGSIGVYSMFPVLDEISEEYGITYDGIKTHPFADLRTSDRSPTAEEWEIIHSSTMETYDDFLDRVSEGRKMDRTHAAEIAEGRVWTGLDALELGLVDEIGGLRDAIAKAAELAETDDWRIKTYEREDDFRTRILRSFNVSVIGETGLRENTMSKLPANLLSIFNYLNQLDDPNHTYARLPYDIIIE